MVIYNDIVSEICRTIGSTEVESGGIIGEKDGVISSYFFDRDAKRTSNEYYPNAGLLNEIIEDWYYQGISFAGIVHSHPFGRRELSSDDIKYAKNILCHNCEITHHLYFPIVQISPETGAVELFPYKLNRDKSLTLVNLKVFNRSDIFGT
ncbi:MAG: hypothetical protein ACI4IJ_02025 [Acutalibacteraceae bacterium]